MDNQYWQQQQRLKRSSISSATPYSQIHSSPAIPSALRYNDNSMNNNNNNNSLHQNNSHHNNPYAGYLQQQQHMQARQQAQVAQAMLSNVSNTQTERSSYYETHYPLYHCEWSNLSDVEVQNVAVSTYREDSVNKLQVLHAFPNYESVTETNEGHDDEHDEDEEEEEDEDDIVMEGVPNNNRSTNNSHSKSTSSSSSSRKGKTLSGYNLYKVSEVNVNYPVTNLQWDPSMVSGRSNVERLATSSECLRVYEVETDIITGESKLSEKLTLTNSKNNNFNALPPLTSFDWNKQNPNEIITGSIDTTCTLWDLTKGSASMAKTQLIAHDSEVFDVKFLHGSKHLFSSCGNDGSIRVFDLRSLEHSTIVYEPQLASVTAGVPQTYHKPQPLVRLAASNTNMNHIAAIEANQNRILVLDLRYPGIPMKILDHHSAPINSIKWHPTKNYLLSAADDCQAFIYDLSNLDDAKPPQPAPTTTGAATNTTTNTSATTNNNNNTKPTNDNNNTTNNNYSSSSSSSSASPSSSSAAHSQSGSASVTPANATLLNNSTNAASAVTSSSSSSSSSSSANSAASTPFNSTDLPISRYTDELEINNVCWAPDGDWIGVVSGKGFQIVNVE